MASAGTRACMILAALLLAVPAAAQGATLRGKVAKVVDGDSVSVKVGKRARTFDLGGINAPELSGDAAATCFGNEAKARLARLLKKGRAVKVRTLGGRRAEVVAGRLNVNRAMVRGGHARALAGGGRRGAQLRKDEAVAQQNGAGLHRACAPASGTPGAPAPGGTEPAPTPTPTAPGDVTGQAAIDQLTTELRDMHFARFKSGNDSSESFHLHLCGDSRFRYFTEFLYSNFGHSRSESLGQPWNVTEAVIKPNGDRGAVVKGTITSEASSSGPQPVEDPNAESVLENFSGQWYWNREPAQASPGQASCDPVLQH